MGYTAYYFRKRFEVARTTGKGTLQLTHITDDGAIFYLNGLEIYRFNMPTGTVSAATFAITNLDSQCMSRFIAVTNLIMGENVLAVEVHQANPDGGDVVFGADLTGTLEKPLPEPVNLRVLRLSPMAVSISWPGENGILQSGFSMTGPWSDMATNSPRSTSLMDSNVFFRLRPR
jgi:hypothetical protein